MSIVQTTGLDRATLERIASINLNELKRCIDELLAKEVNVRKVLLISPVVADYTFLRRHYPQFEFYITLIDDWNFNDPCPLRLGYFDLAIASNVLMYSTAPQRWIDHILAVCRFLAVQDLVYRKRNATPPYLGNDTDAVRYCHSGKGVSSPFPTPFDLATLSQKILTFATYEGGTNEFHAEHDRPVHFVAVVESSAATTMRVEASRSMAAWRFKVRNIAFANGTINRIYRILVKLKRAVSKP